MMSCPVRGGPGLAWTVNPAMPLPDPDAGATVNHSAWLEAVQGHPSSVVTWMIPPPPEADTEADAGLISNVQLEPGDLTQEDPAPAIVVVFAGGTEIERASLEKGLGFGMVETRFGLPHHRCRACCVRRGGRGSEETPGSI